MARSPSSRRWALRHEPMGYGTGVPKGVPTITTGHGEALTDGGPVILSHSLSWHTLYHKNTAKPYKRNGHMYGVNPTPAALHDMQPPVACKPEAYVWWL